MSSLVTRSRCLRVNHLRLPRRARALGTYTRLNLKALALDGGSGCLGLGPLLSRPSLPSRLKMRMRTALFHSFVREELPKPRRRADTSSRFQPKLASPSSVGSSSFSKSNSNSNSNSYFKSKPSKSKPTKKRQEPWQARGSMGASRKKTSQYGSDFGSSNSKHRQASDEPMPQAQPPPRGKKAKTPKPREVAQLLGQRTAGSPLDPSAPLKLDAELGIDRYRSLPWKQPPGFGGAYGSGKERKRALLKERRRERKRSKLQREMEEVERREGVMRKRGLVGPVQMSKALWREVKYKDRVRKEEKEGTRGDGGGHGKEVSSDLGLPRSEYLLQKDMLQREKDRLQPSASSSSASGLAKEREDRHSSSPSSPSTSSATSQPSLSSSSSSFTHHPEPEPSPISSRPSNQPKPSPQPNTHLDFSHRKERQRSWSSTMEKSWSTVGLASSNARDYPDYYNQNQNHNYNQNQTPAKANRSPDTHSLSALTARNNPRARFSPTAWASATRFSSPASVPMHGGRLGRGGSAGATSRYRRGVDVERLRRKVVFGGGLGGEPRVFEDEYKDDFGRDRKQDQGRNQDQDQRKREGEHDEVRFGISRRWDTAAATTTRATATATATTTAPRASASDFSRKMSVRKSHAVEQAVLQAAHGPLQDQDEFYHPPKAVTSLTSLSSSFSPSRTAPSRRSSSPVYPSSPAYTSSPSSSAHPSSSADPLTLSSSETAHTFSSPPLLPGFLSALKEKFGEGVKPTLIQGLSMRWVLEGFGNRFFGGGGALAAREDKGGEEGEGDAASGPNAGSDVVIAEPTPTAIQMQTQTQEVMTTTTTAYRQFLLAAETGSGKSIAYLLPLLQNLKLTEPSFRARLSSSFSSLPPPTTTTTTSTTSHSYLGTQPPRRKKDHDHYEHAPRALVLAPTHELARQLAVFAKDLLHFPDTRLRVMCASLSNTTSVSGEERRRGRLGRSEFTSKDMFKGVVFDNDVRGEKEGAADRMEEGKEGRKMPADVFVGTPFKLLEMVWGRGMDKMMRRAMEASQVYTAAAASGGGGGGYGALSPPPQAPLEFGRWRTKTELGLENVEYVVIDEADVLFDKDFEETTRLLLADIAAARGHPVPYILNSDSSNNDANTHPGPITYPFHLILTSATIPNTLNTYLTHAHPEMVRLASPRLHKLPKGLSTEYVDWTGGNKWKDVLYRLKRVWAEDAMVWRVHKAREGMEDRGLDHLLRGRAADTGRGLQGAKDDDDDEGLSKVVIFCNASRRVDDLSAYLAENGVPNVPVTSGSENRRQRSSNSYLRGFLKDPKSGRVEGTPPPRKWGGRDWRSRSGSDEDSASAYTQPSSSYNAGAGTQPKTQPKVLITTSLLSRGLDFSPDVKHVFIIDHPRNMIDFLHRAGRAGRAGEKGKVVVFGKMRGRGSARFREVRGQVGKLGGKARSS